MVKNCRPVKLLTAKHIMAAIQQKIANFRHPGAAVTLIVKTR